MKCYENSKEVHGYVYHTGTVVLKLSSDVTRAGTVSSFSDGLAPAKAKDKGCGNVDNTGNFVIPHSFTQARPYRAVLDNGKVKNSGAYIDKTGKIIWSR